MKRLMQSSVVILMTGLISTFAVAGAPPPPPVPGPVAGAFGPVGLGIAVVAYVGYKIYKHFSD